MCGIAGIWNFDGKPISEEEIIRFTDTVAHRGPDGRGIWRNEKQNIAFGHRRLAIIDLSNEANQPMAFADERYHIVFNGEIFNFIEIREELLNKGYQFKTDSDTEVILASYHAWGEKMLPRFNGMWAIIIHDRETDSCFIARDRFGIKPLHFRITDKQFAFSSELRTFKSLEGFRITTDKDSASIFLKTGFGVEGTSRTLFEGVRKLKAGHCGVVSSGKISIKQWWETSSHLIEVPEDENEQAERFRELFYDAVKLRMRSDVSVGTCLSGGFDSSAVVCALAETGKLHADTRQSKEWQQSFVATFPGKSNDERPQAEEVINYSGVKGHFFEVKEDEALSLIDQVLNDFDDVYVGIPVAPWLIYRELRKNHVVVSLDGHGADELMGAYMPWQGALLSDAPSWIGNFGANKNLLEEAGASHIKDKLNLSFKYHPEFEMMRSALHRFKSFKDRFIRAESTACLTIEAISKNHTDFLFNEPDDMRFMDETNRLLYRMFHHDVLPTILRNFDRVSMSHGIEIRMPFMDWRLVQYVFSLPGKSKIGGGFTKRIAREAMQQHMPESIRSSKVKIGFNSPMPEWFSGPLKPWIEEVVKQKEHELIDMDVLRNTIATNHKNQSWNWSNTGNVWKCLHYLWFENQFLKS